MTTGITLAGKAARVALLGATFLASAPGPAPAEDLEAAAIAAGETEYLSACAGCHGRDATGNGPLAELMHIETPDLTAMSARNDGVFPFAETLRIIDGRETVRAHGGDMPLWGARYMISAIGPDPEDMERAKTAATVAQGRIISLAYYLESLQQ